MALPGQPLHAGNAAAPMDMTTFFQSLIKGSPVGESNPYFNALASPNGYAPPYTRPDEGMAISHIGMTELLMRGRALLTNEGKQILASKLLLQSSVSLDVLLPPKISDNLQFQLDSIEWMGSPMRRTPEEAPSDIIELTKNSKTGALERRGKGIYLQLETLGVEEGKRLYVTGLVTLRNCYEDTKNFGILYALLMANDFRRSYLMSKNIIPRLDIESLINYDIDRTFPLQKLSNAWASYEAYTNELTRKMNKKLDTYVFAEEMSPLLPFIDMGKPGESTTVPANLSTTRDAGQDGAVNKIYSLMTGRMVITVSVPSVDPHNRAYNPMIRFRQIGEFNLMKRVEKTYTSKINNYETIWNSVWIYDQEQDRMHMVTQQDAVKNCHAFKNPNAVDKYGYNKSQGGRHSHYSDSNDYETEPYADAFNRGNYDATGIVEFPTGINDTNLNPQSKYSCFFYRREKDNLIPLKLFGEIKPEHFETNRQILLGRTMTNMNHSAGKHLVRSISDSINSLYNIMHGNSTGNPMGRFNKFLRRSPDKQVSLVKDYIYDTDFIQDDRFNKPRVAQQIDWTSDTDLKEPFVFEDNTDMELKMNISDYLLDQPSIAELDRLAVFIGACFPGHPLLDPRFTSSHSKYLSLKNIFMDCIMAIKTLPLWIRQANYNARQPGAELVKTGASPILVSKRNDYINRLKNVDPSYTDAKYNVPSGAGALGTDTNTATNTLIKDIVDTPNVNIATMAFLNPTKYNYIYDKMWGYLLSEWTKIISMRAGTFGASDKEAFDATVVETVENFVKLNTDITATFNTDKDGNYPKESDLLALFEEFIITFLSGYNSRTKHDKNLARIRRKAAEEAKGASTVRDYFLKDLPSDTERFTVGVVYGEKRRGDLEVGETAAFTSGWVRTSTGVTLPMIEQYITELLREVNKSKLETLEHYITFSDPEDLERPVEFSEYSGFLRTLMRLKTSRHFPLDIGKVQIFSDRPENPWGHLPTPLAIEIYDSNRTWKSDLSVLPFYKGPSSGATNYDARGNAAVDDIDIDMGGDDDDNMGFRDMRGRRGGGNTGRRDTGTTIRDGIPDIFRRYIITYTPTAVLIHNLVSLARIPSATDFERAMARAYLCAPFTSDNLLSMCDNNIIIPVQFIIARPHMTYQTLTGLLLKRGEETGNFMYRPIDYRVTVDGVKKVVQGHMTAYMKAVVKNEDNVMVLPDLATLSTLSGVGVKPYSPENYKARRPYNALETSSIFFFMTHYNDTPNKYMDLSGSFNYISAFAGSDNGESDVYNKDSLHYNTAAFYNALYVFWNHGDVGKRDLFDDRVRESSYGTGQSGPTRNTIIIQGHTQYFNPAKNDYSDILYGSGHWGRNVYPGVRATREGKYQPIIDLGKVTVT